MIPAKSTEWKITDIPAPLPANDNSFTAWLRCFADKQRLAAEGYRTLNYYDLANFKFLPNPHTRNCPPSFGDGGGGFFYELCAGLAFLLFLGAACGLLMIVGAV